VIEAWANEKTLVSFDGRVVELFAIAFETGNSGPSARYHVANLYLDVDDPDRHGRRRIELRPLADGTSHGQSLLYIEAAQWPQFEPLIGQVLAALPPPAPST
jgi:hypothetical protein